MDKELFNALEEIGLSKNEAKIYLTLLEIGPSSCSKIADVSKTHRPNCYEVLDRLVQKGLAKYITKDQTKNYEATEPASLHRMVQRKSNVLEKVMPRLELLKTICASQAKVSVHEGETAFRNILHQMLERNEPITISGIPEKKNPYVKEIMEAFHNVRIEKRVKMRHIYHEDAKERIKELSEREHTLARYIPGKEKTEASTLCCGDEVIHILWNASPMVAIKITSPELAASQRNNFDLLWNAAETQSLNKWIDE